MIALRILGVFLVIFVFASCAAPRAGFNFQRDTDVVPAAVTFENISENSESFEWDFGDGTKSTEPNPTHRFLSSGRQTITLTAIKGKKTNTYKQEFMFESPEQCLVQFETSFGNMLIQLFDETPQHRDNFLKLAEEGYYDGLLFHRVINGFMIQGGDPNSRGADAGTYLGTGGPGYQVPAEFVDDLVHVKGALAAARQGDAVNPQKKSSGSQFYLVQGRAVSPEELEVIASRKGTSYTEEQRAAYAQHGGTPFLDRDYTVFGRVIEGLEVIDQIAAVQTGAGDRPLKDVTMKVVVVQ